MLVSLSYVILIPSEVTARDLIGSSSHLQRVRNSMAYKIRDEQTKHVQEARMQTVIHTRTLKSKPSYKRTCRSESELFTQEVFTCIRRALVLLCAPNLLL